MDKSFRVHLPASGNESGRGAAAAPPRGHRQRASKAPGGRRERPRAGERQRASEATAEREAEVKLKATVVDIDRVRDDEAKEESLETAEQDDGLKRKNLGVFEWCLMTLALALVLLFLPLSIWFCVKVVREHERAVIFRLGHLLRERPRGPGLIFYLPLLDVCHKVDIRLRILNVPPHTAVTKDLVRPELSAVCHYQIENVARCSAALSSPTEALQAVVQAAVRDVVARHTLGQVLLQRRRLGGQIQTAADSVACRWGIRVERADIDEITFPPELQRSLAAEAEATRQQQARAKAAEVESAAWEGLRSSFRHLHPALVLPFPPDLLSLTSDHSSLPPPPPSPPPPPPPAAMEEEGRVRAGECETDSPMM